jgi:hypothetical protein
MTRKDAQRYRCHNCDSIFNDLIETTFSDHKLSLSDMFHIIWGIEEDKTAEIIQELDRTYKMVLDFDPEPTHTREEGGQLNNGLAAFVPGGPACPLLGRSSVSIPDGNTCPSREGGCIHVESLYH